MRAVLAWMVLLWGVCAAPILAQTRTLEERLAWQIALEREGFSPGIIDGKIGSKTALATEYFQRVRGLKPTGKLDEATIAALKLMPGMAITEHLVEAADLEGITPFTEDWNERARMARLGYYTVLDGLAERFHASKSLLEALNPGVNFEGLRAGTPLRVPAVLTPAVARATSLRVDLSRKLIFALDATGQIVAMFHCSIAAKVEKRPDGETTIIHVIRNPDYTFDPASWPEVKNVNRRLLIPPGPRNPVGLAWVGLDLPGYGIHGTPHPEMIGKTGSHGCFRMTNWDAVRLSRMVSRGARVEFVHGER